MLVKDMSLLTQSFYSVERIENNSNHSSTTNLKAVLSYELSIRSVGRFYRLTSPVIFEVSVLFIH
jgi:hypothetical protein